MNYIARYSLCKRIGSTFTENVIGSVDIGAYLLSIFGTVQAVPAPNPFSTEDVLFFVIWPVVWKRIKVKKAGFTGIALFPDFYLDTYECSL
ncbi:MAG TPA: hypothetical protein VK140_14900 [Ktedonobacteraceae bacterium]|nr:hypothetical protein [Ktedonobacteraceae bacterium]